LSGDKSQSAAPDSVEPATGAEQGAQSIAEVQQEAESAADDVQTAESSPAAAAEPLAAPADSKAEDGRSAEAELEDAALKPVQWAMEPDSAAEVDPLQEQVWSERVKDSVPLSPSAEDTDKTTASDRAAELPGDAGTELQSAAEAAFATASQEPEQSAAEKEEPLSAFNWTVPSGDDDFDITGAAQPMPIFASSGDTGSGQALDPKVHQELTDKLNMALLLFESDAQDEAAELSREVLQKGDAELAARAQELLTKYGRA
ncbi:MAG: hypothetical protein IAB19_03775, partial [Proteobacteria bacterium]|nr:hypothetical protein [Candidatus Avisuccinivibrio stercorigallinarum]